MKNMKQEIDERLQSRKWSEEIVGRVVEKKKISTKKNIALSVIFVFLFSFTGFLYQEQISSENEALNYEEEVISTLLYEVSFDDFGL